ncbi:penicillin binding protein PBP4B [Cryobacterium aureum]|uniref:penicillin binding protein PBP4B n=1 Tax=Cryobacterium aureum TaxID=995037 RepID=UPI00101AD2B0|nr:penicillin binding protein PBP4B [Cryobacterium aureum]
MTRPSASALGGNRDASGDGRDGWQTSRFVFAGAMSPYCLGFADAAVPEESLRWIRVPAGSAEVWILEGDSRGYARPVPVSCAVARNGTRYLAVGDLPNFLGVTVQSRRNELPFEGAAPGHIATVTLQQGRECFTIATETNRLGCNITARTSGDHGGAGFRAVDGFSAGDTYFLSVEVIVRLFQVGFLTRNGQDFFLPRHAIAYDQLHPVRWAEDVGFCTGALDQVDDYIAGQIRDGASSLAVSIVKDGRVVRSRAFGYACRFGSNPAAELPAQLLPESEWLPATTATLYDLASNTKMFATTFAIQRLLSAGTLDLDRAVGSFPGWENFTDSANDTSGKWAVGGRGGVEARHSGKATITIRDLLQHVGGLLPDPQYANRTEAGALFYQGGNTLDRSGIIDAICRTPLLHPPHTAFAYSDVDFMILGLLVEQIAGETLDDFVEREIMAPLGLHDTVFTPLMRGFLPTDIAATELNGNTRDGHVDFGVFPDGTAVPVRTGVIQGEVHDEKAFYSMGGVSGHAGLFSTVGDLSVLTQVMLNGGLYNGTELFSREVVDEFTTPRSLTGSDADASTIALGWRVHSRVGDGYYYFDCGPSRSSFGHQGWTGTLTVIDPHYNLSIAILSNFRHSPVVRPPNGFAGADFAIADLVPVVQRIYAALR